MVAITLKRLSGKRVKLWPQSIHGSNGSRYFLTVLFFKNGNDRTYFPWNRDFLLSDDFTR